MRRCHFAKRVEQGAKALVTTAGNFQFPANRSQDRVHTVEANATVRIYNDKTNDVPRLKCHFSYDLEQMALAGTVVSLHEQRGTAVISRTRQRLLQGMQLVSAANGKGSDVLGRGYSEA